MILYVIRAVWIVSHIFVLGRMFTSGPRYPWFAAYMCLSCMLAVAYWPELLPGWKEAFAGWIVGVLLLRTVACLEAVHVQTREFPRWSRMMLGAFGVGFTVVLMLAAVRDSQWAGNAVELRRYLQVWTWMVMLSVQVTLVDREWWHFRVRDWHALAMFFVAANHGAVSIWAMRSHPAGAAWLNLNSWSTAADAAVYLAWALCRKRERYTITEGWTGSEASCD